MAEDSSNLVTVEELAKMVRKSVPTIYRHLKYGVPKKQSRGLSIDVGQLPDVWVGGNRFWYRSAVEKLIEEAKEAREAMRE